MKQITLLLLACVGLSLVAQNTPYVPPKLSPRDSIVGEITDLVCYGKVIQTIPFQIKTHSFIKHRIKIYNKLKDRIGITDTCVEVVTLRSSNEMHAYIWNPTVGTVAVFFINKILKDQDLRGYLGFIDDNGEYSAVKDDEVYSFHGQIFKKEYQLMKYLTQMKSLNIPDSLGNEEVYYKRMKADSIARRQMLRKQFAEERLKVQREKALKDSSEAKRLICTTIA